MTLNVVKSDNLFTLCIKIYYSALVLCTPLPEGLVLCTPLPEGLVCIISVFVTILNKVKNF